MRWGSEEWFRNKIWSQGVDDPGAYFSHAKNGYQRYRHQQLVSLARNVGLFSGVSGIRIGEVGCGTGNLLKQFKDGSDASYAIGMDFVPEAISVARKAYPDIEFAVGRLPQLPTEMKDMDLIIASEVLYYLDEDGRDAAVRSLWRALKPGGSLIFSSVLGGRYFDERSALHLLQTVFDITAISFQYNRLYHRLVQPATLISAAKFRLYAGTEGVDDAGDEFMDSYRKLASNPVIRAGIYTMAALFSPILTWSWLPHVCNGIAERTGPERFKSNIVIVARKPRDALTDYGHGDA